MVHVSLRRSGPAHTERGREKGRSRRKDTIMMRRTFLLLLTTALALIAAGGIALAATFTCTTSPCNGTTENDQITGTLQPETINGRGGDDQISALDANDTIKGQGGTDTLNGQLGNDRLNGGIGNDTMDGGDGNDRYRFSDNFGADRIEADSSGVDTLDFSRISTPDSTGGDDGIEIDLIGPDPPCSGTTFRTICLGGEFIENLVGSPFSDFVTGNSLKNKISGADGNDYMHGGAANDNMQGDSGSDVLIGEAGNDKLDGGEGGDQYNVTSNWGSETVLDPNTASSSSVSSLAWVAGDFQNPPTVPLTFNLVSGTGPEVTDHNGNTLNWEDNAIARAAGGPAGDTFIQNSSSNNMVGYGGADTYKGYGPGGPASGSDLILEADTSTASDKLDLTNFNLADITKWETAAGSPGGTANDKSLLITFADGSKIQIFNYFNLNGGTDICTSKQGRWYMETIAFADDPNVDFAQVKGLLGCP